MFTEYIPPKLIKASISTDFKHILSANSPDLSNNYHISYVTNDNEGGKIIRLTLGITSSIFEIIWLDTRVLTLSENTAELVLNNRIRQAIQKHKNAIIREIFEYAEQQHNRRSLND